MGTKERLKVENAADREAGQVDSSHEHLGIMLPKQL